VRAELQAIVSKRECAFEDPIAFVVSRERAPVDAAFVGLNDGIIANAQLVLVQRGDQFRRYLPHRDRTHCFRWQRGFQTVVAEHVVPDEKRKDGEQIHGHHILEHQLHEMGNPQVRPDVRVEEV